MKNLFLRITPSLILILTLCGCSATNQKIANLSIIYGAATVLSLLLLVGCLIIVRQKKHWFVLLFSSVLVVNAGYTLLSISPNLNIALWANRISYLGAVFLPISMLMIILNITNTRYTKRLPSILVCIAVLVFLLAASPGILDIYYKEVSFTVINGVSTLVKVYGPLHPLYLIYLLGYFALMVGIIIRASLKRTIDTTSHAVFVAIAVFVNIGVWFIEQITNIDFEFLSISYIISELFLIGVHLVMKENQRLKELIAQKDRALIASKATKGSDDIPDEVLAYFIAGIKTLTTTESTIYKAYISGSTTKEIMTTLNIKENTLKFHNKNIYGKLGVSSRKELLNIHRAIETKK